MRYLENELLWLTIFMCLAYAVEEPVLTNYPVDGYFIIEGNASVEYYFSCLLTFDSKVVWTWRGIHWRTNMPSLVDKRVTNDDVAIRSVGTSYSNETSLKTEINVKLTPNTQNLLDDTDWWCVAEYKVSGDDAKHTLQSKRMPFRLQGIKTISDAPPTAMAGNLWKMVVMCVVGVVVCM